MSCALVIDMHRCRFAVASIVALHPLVLFSAAWAQEPGEPMQPAPPAQPPPPQHPAQAHASSKDPERPAVRAEEGDWGMFFRFGGLATLIATNNTRNVGPLAETQVGMKYVFSEHWMMPFFAGFGYRNNSVENGPTDNEKAADVGAGVEYHFRIWRRISPFVGGQVGLGIADPNGAHQFKFGIGFGPVLGVEFYVADRVSLAAQYLLTFQVETQNQDHTAFQLSTLAGGALNLTFYF
jgi:hypothetical protein